MIPEVTIKITMTEGASTTAAGPILVTEGAEAIPPPPQLVEGVAESDALVPLVPSDVGPGIEVDIPPPALLEGGEPEDVVPAPPQGAVADSPDEGYLYEFAPPEEAAANVTESTLGVPPVPDEEVPVPDDTP